MDERLGFVARLLDGRSDQHATIDQWLSFASARTMDGPIIGPRSGIHDLGMAGDVGSVRGRDVDGVVHVRRCGARIRNDRRLTIASHL